MCLPSFFDPSLNRVTFLEKFPHTDFLLVFFKREYVAYLGSECVARLPSISFYFDELTFDDDAELSEQGDEFYEVDDEFFDLENDDEEETFEIEEEGTEDEQMLDPNRMLNASHPSIDDFDDVFNSEIPLKLSPVPWFSIIGQPTPHIYHERSGFFSFQSIYLGSFVLINLPLRFTVFSLYCFFRNLFFFFTNFEFLEDYFRP